MAEDFKIASLFVEVLGIAPADGHISGLFTDVYGQAAADGHLSGLYVEVWGLPSSGRTGLQGEYVVQGASLELQGFSIKRRRGQLP